MYTHSPMCCGLVQLIIGGSSRAATALTVLFSMAYPCSDAKYAHPDVLKDGDLVRFQCPVGQYNELATLMFTSGHNAVILLFRRHEVSPLTGVGQYMFSGGSVAIFLVIYFPLAACSVLTHACTHARTCACAHARRRT